MLALVWLLIITGIAFAGKGLTGYVTSQTCCSDELCPLEYRCSAIYPDVQVPKPAESELFFAIGVLFIASASVAFVAYRRFSR
jgi:hypothetical protein